MKCLITGGAGFIGSHLAERLIAEGCQVTILDNLSTGRPGNLDAICHSRELEFIEGDILDSDLVARAMAGCDEVYHLAAVVGVKRVLEDPLTAMQVNLLGTEIVLRHAARISARFLFTSSSEVYGNSAHETLAEHSPRTYGSTTHSRWSYAGAKAMGEFLTLAQHAQHALPAVIVRLFNVIGVRQIGRYGMVLPTFVRQALDGAPITVYGSGRQTRCFIDVADAVDGLIRLQRSEAAIGGIFNIAGTRSLSIRELARTVKRLTGSTAPIVTVPYDVAYPPGFAEIEKRRPDTTAIRAAAGFMPYRTIELTIEAIAAHLRREDVLREAASPLLAATLPGRANLRTNEL